MSNVYPEWWDTTITVFNKAEDKQTHVISWYKTVLSNCFWKYVGNKVTVGDTTLQTNNIICRVPKDGRFLDKYEWILLPNDQKAAHFTFGGGDIIVKGSVSDIIDEYTKGSRSTDLIAKYKELQGCMQIEQWTIDTGPGRCCEHYYIIGV